MPTPTGARIIAYVLEVRRLITYTELADHLGMLEHQVSSPLRPIRRACRDELELSRLDALFVCRDDHLPGDHFNEDGARLTREQHLRHLEEIREYGLGRLSHALLAA